MSADISMNNIVKLTRGDTFSAPLFINGGTPTKPTRYHLKTGRKIEKQAMIVEGSILAVGSIIKSGSVFEGQQVTSDIKLEEVKILTKTATLEINSLIRDTSIIKSGSILDDRVLTKDLTILSDQIYLGVMEPNQPFECAIIKKTYTSENLNENGDVVIRLDPDDTVCLIPGKYFYQIKSRLVNKDETYDVHTIVGKTELWIIE